MDHRVKHSFFIIFSSFSLFLFFLSFRFFFLFIFFFLEAGGWGGSGRAEVVVHVSS